MSQPARTRNRAAGYDPFSSEVKADPHRFFDSLRSSCPVHHHRLEGPELERINAHPLVGRPTNEFWSVFRYADCAAILQDPQRFSSRQGPGPERLTPLNEEGMLLFADEPAHRIQRRIANKAFTPRMVEQLRPHIQATVDALIDGFADRGRVDLMADFGVPLTLRVIARVLGVGEERLDDFWRWGKASLEAFGGDEEAVQRSFGALMELFTFLMDLVGRPRAMLEAGEEPPADVLTALITADFEGRSFTDEELLMASQQLLTAGFETTSTAIATGIHLLRTHPLERRKLEKDPVLIETAVEEILRFEAPIEGLFRTATDAVEVAGCPIPADAKVRVMYASANRDERQFADAGTFRVDRDPTDVRRHLAFGFGPHACIGAALARTEMQLAIGTLLRRLPGIDLDPDRPPTRETMLSVNGYRTMPVRWDPRGVRAASAPANETEETL